MGVRFCRIFASTVATAAARKGPLVLGGDELASEVLRRPLYDLSPRGRRALGATLRAVSRNDLRRLQGQGHPRRSRLHGDDRERLQSRGGVTRGREGALAVHGTNGAAIRLAGRPLG